MLRDDVLFEIAGRRRLVIAVLAGETLARMFGQFVTLKVDRVRGPVVAGVARVADTLVLRLLVLFQIVIRCAQVVTQIAGVTKPLVLGQNMLFQITYHRGPIVALFTRIPDLFMLGHFVRAQILWRRGAILAHITGEAHALVA